MGLTPRPTAICSHPTKHCAHVHHIPHTSTHYPRHLIHCTHGDSCSSQHPTTIGHPHPEASMALLSPCPHGPPPPPAWSPPSAPGLPPWMMNATVLHMASPKDTSTWNTTAALQQYTGSTVRRQPRALPNPDASPPLP